MPRYNTTSRLLERTVIMRENQWVAEIVDFFEARCVLKRESVQLVLGSLSHLAIVEYCWRKVTQFILEGFCCKVLVDHDSLSRKFSGEYPSLFLSIGGYLDSWLRRHLFGTLTTPFDHSIDHNTVHTAQDLVPYFNSFVDILRARGHIASSDSQSFAIQPGSVMVCWRHTVHQ